MTIKIKDLAELRSTLLAMLAEFKADGLSDAQARKQVEKHLKANQYEDGEGTSLSIEFADLETATPEPGASAIGQAVAKAIEPLLKALDKRGSGKDTIAPQISITDPVERMFFDKTDPTFKTWNYDNIGDFGMDCYLHGRKTGATTRPRLANIIKAADAFHRGLWQTKATPTTYASELVGADGGFLVPPEYREKIWIAIEAQSEFLPLIDLTPTSSNVVNMPVDQNAPWDNTSGILSYWRQQAATMSPSKLIVQNRQIPLNELYAFVAATDEVLADAPRLNNYLGVKAPQKLTYQIDDAIIRGNGQGQPLGLLLNNPSAQTITANATSSAGWSLTDLANMYPHMIQPMGVSIDEPKAWWVMTPRSYAQMPTLTSGTTAGFPLALTNANIAGRIVTQALGIPIRVSAHLPGYDQAGAVSLLNFQGYVGFNKQEGFDFQSSIHLYFDSGATAFRWTYRFGGEPMLRTTIASPNDTGNALSHAILLGATA